MKLTLLLALLTVCECDSSRVKGHTGQDVTLPCKYDRKYYGALSACWQRGEIPTRGCSNQLISTDGLRVETRASSRYQLLGRLEDGDVSLTITNLTEGDAGRYGCRVEIPGWFNDDKHHFDLTVVDDPSGTTDAPTSTAWTTDTPTESTSSSQTEGHVTSTESPLTSSSSVKFISKVPQTMAPLIAVLLVLVFLLTLGGLVVAALRRRSAQVSRSSSAPRHPLCTSRAPPWTTSTRWRVTVMVAMMAMVPMAMAATAVIEVEEKTGETMSTAPDRKQERGVFQEDGFALTLCFESVQSESSRCAPM
ncbi:T-cell immunoglobulin and mucin domain-containing protein 4 isoform X1 [Oreochromis niloticus]|uniref:T-cell immunoglobulin and mucin domain-containing protein 4 isoform X1 n=1 Tax=Oreochromis niloticus TaxID=8128 RepID=UPI000DF37CED|nr:T-cell immunoglobulin and mucin domain-containing protein 4 isoform X1 [Oreochromis niloticus]